MHPELLNDVATARKEAGLTQEDLATAAGVSRQTIGAIEKGDYSPSTLLALRLALVLEVPLERLFVLPTKAADELRARRDALRIDGANPRP